MYVAVDVALGGAWKYIRMGTQSSPLHKAIESKGSVLKGSGSGVNAIEAASGNAPIRATIQHKLARNIEHGHYFWAR